MRGVLRLTFTFTLLAPAFAAQHAVPAAHPRLLGSRAELQARAQQRPDEYRRVVAVARDPGANAHAAIISQSLVAAIEGDGDMARRAIDRALKFVDGPIRKGHETFGHDLALGALAYDLCFSWWSPDERTRFHDYFNRTVEANVRSEAHVFHNGWYGYKNWGIGLAGYATYHENPRAPEILRTLLDDYRTRAAPALELAGEGGGWAEGYYIHYFLYEWLFFCEVARRCEGVDYYALAPKFFSQRAIASMFEMFPARAETNSRRPVPMGDGGGRTFGSDREEGGDYMYVAADASRAYAPSKLRHFTRQIVYLRPGTFVIFDRVGSTQPGFKKTWLLQAMKRPEARGEDLVITNGRGRLVVQPLLPARRVVNLAAGDALYRYDGQTFPPQRNTGPAPECRIEISPVESATDDVFLHVLTATDTDASFTPRANASVAAGSVRVDVAGTRITFRTDSVGGEININGRAATLTPGAP